MGTLARLVLACAAFLLLQEAALRVVFPLPEVANFDRVAYSHLSPDAESENPASLAHASYRWASDPDGFAFVHRLNLYGFRDTEWRLAAAPGTKRVAFVGDSFVEGLSAARRDTIPAAFAAAHGGRVEALNLGIAGADLPTYARVIRDTLPLFQPDVVVLVLYANDVMPIRFVEAWLRDPLVAELQDTQQPRFLHVWERARAGLPVPRRWGNEPFEYLPPVPDPRNPWTDGGLAGRLEAFVTPEIARAIRAGRFNPALVDSLSWYARHLQRPADLHDHVRGLAGAVREAGAEFRLVYLPTKNQVSDRYLAAQAEFSSPGSVASQLATPFQRHAASLVETCAGLDVPFLDLTPTLRTGELDDGPLYWDYDDHMRGVGYRTAAGAIARWIESGDG